MKRLVLSLVLASLAVSCGDDPSGPDKVRAGVLGRDPLDQIHLMENHSSALIAWRRAGVRDRIVVHIDGHSDFDWLPDETVARIAAAMPDEMWEYERHPYAMDDSILSGFSIWNFVYPAARLGLVRELVWVVPDGTLEDSTSAWRLVRELIIDKLERVEVEEAFGLHLDGRVVRGEVLGLPWTVCELRDLPEIEEPVLLDIDLDYFTTRSAISQQVTAMPWIDPETMLATLAEKGIRSEVTTLSLSTIGGYLPPSNRWIGRYLLQRLRDPRSGLSDIETLRREAIVRGAEGAGPEAIAALRELTRIAPDDACAWYCLSRYLREANLEDEGRDALARSMNLDPLLSHEYLFAGDSYWLNGRYRDALDMYRRYRERLPVGPFTAYALRREAGSLMRLGRDDEAIAAYRAVLELAPDHADSLLDLGVLLRERGQVEDAIALFRRARERVPERSTYAMALGTTFLVAGRTDEAIAELRSAVDQRPTWVRARTHLATALVDLGEYARARDEIRIVLSIDSRNPAARRLARIVAQQGVDLTDP